MAEGMAQPQPVVKSESLHPTPTPAQTQSPHQQVEQSEVEQQLRPSLSIPENLIYKNRLQEYAQRASLPLPVYQTWNEGFPHAPKFRSSILVDGEIYTSPNTFSQRKAAEQDAAKHALEGITLKMSSEGSALICKDTLFCKSILNEFAVKMNLERPTFSTKHSEGPLQMFTASLDFNGVKYTGEVGRNKKEAEQLAARAVLLSILGNSSYGTLLFEIIKTKSKVYSAINELKGSHSATIVVPNEETSGSGSGTSRSQEKECEDANRAGNMLATAFSEASCGQVSGHPTVHQSLNEFVKLNPVSAPEAIAPPNKFLPVVENQPLPVDLVSGKKRSCKSKKKANKKVKKPSRLPVSALPVNQVTSCPIAQ
ncbi:hypothetical protein Ancab_034860 [Ancistrocladus abbreviatus]